MVDFDKIEELAKEYIELKKGEQESKSKKAAINLMDLLSSKDFAFPLKKEVAESNGTATYLYLNNKTYPHLFEFIAEILHLEIPIIVNNVKFGPGEIIVNSDNEKDAKQELDSCVKELQKLINGKKNKVFAI
ncbi:MAG TPA: hypothetical protein VFH25_04855 [Nitrososphaeraceae archaeon]|nr:hypothetical protein [Nitrososphaeraceae archaeon]